jgi:hypothetical protein
MKKLLLLLTVITASLLFGQKNGTIHLHETFEIYGKTLTIDQRVTDYFGTDYVIFMKKNHPEGLLYWNFHVQNACFIYPLESKLPPQNHLRDFITLDSKSMKSKDPNSQQLSLETFNILNTRISTSETIQVFRTDEPGKVLAVLSTSLLLEKYNTYKNSLH